MQGNPNPPGTHWQVPPVHNSKPQQSKVVLQLPPGRLQQTLPLRPLMRNSPSQMVFPWPVSQQVWEFVQGDCRGQHTPAVQVPPQFVWPAGQHCPLEQFPEQQSPFPLQVPLSATQHFPLERTWVLLQLETQVLLLLQVRHCEASQLPQESVPPQVSEGEPQVAPTWLQVFGVQQAFW
jgi:hypothetical protein